MFCDPNYNSTLSGERKCKLKRKNFILSRIIQSGDVQSDQSFIGECAKKPVFFVNAIELHCVLYF